MDYIITDEGLRVLEKKGLKKIVDENFKTLESPHLFMVDEEEEYIKNHRVHKRFEELTGDSSIMSDSYGIFSFFNANTLVEQGKIPDDLSDGLMTAIGVYVNTRHNTEGFMERRRSWRNEVFHTSINADVHGDFFLQQYNHKPEDSQGVLFEGCESLVKKLEEKDKGKLYGHYDYWTAFLSHLITFCCQTGQEVPFKDNFEDVFYLGEFSDAKSGMVMEPFLKKFIYCIKKENLFDYLPELPGFEKQKKEGKLPSGGMIENSQGFIMNGNLVYCYKNKNGPIKFAHNCYNEPDVFLTPDMMKDAVYSAFSLMMNGAGRVMRHDPGLLMKYFPYFLFEVP